MMLPSGSRTEITSRSPTHSLHHGRPVAAPRTGHRPERPRVRDRHLGLRPSAARGGPDRYGPRPDVRSRADIVSVHRTERRVPRRGHVAGMPEAVTASGGAAGSAIDPLRGRLMDGRRLNGVRVKRVCFSPQADFVAGAVVAGIGVETLRRVRARRELIVSALPLLFGIHQLVEGFVWLELRGQVSPGVGDSAKEAYILYAHAVLPAIVPLGFMLLEPDRRRSRVMLAMASARAWACTCCGSSPHIRSEHTSRLAVSITRRIPQTTPSSGCRTSP